MFRRMLFRLFPVLFMAGSLPAQSVAPPSAGAQEPFESFAVLDKQLSLLDRQVADLKESTQQTPAKSGAGKRARRGRPWIRQSRELRPTAISISRESYKLYRLYAPRERHLHNRMFTRLYRRSRVLKRDLAKVAQSRNRAAAKRAETRLSRALVAFVVQFQKVSGGYAGLHCEAAEWGCCEFKRSRHKGPYDSCRWACVKTVQNCRRGFLGPNILRNFAETR